MISDKLTLDDQDGTIWLVVTSSSGVQHREPIRLRPGFGIDEVQQAVLATTAVRQFGDELRLSSHINCESLRNALEAMFGYFDAPDQPGVELLEIQKAVAEYDAVQELQSAIPPYAYAWLDVIVREDLADEALSANPIWRKTKITIDLARHCDRRVAEMVARYSQRTASQVMGAMAPSVPTRQVPTRQAVESRAKSG